MSQQMWKLQGRRLRWLKSPSEETHSQREDDIRISINYITLTLC